jgi:hypothetical protein
MSKDKLKKEELKKINYLELTPVRVHEFSEKDDGLVDVLVPRFQGGLFKKIFQEKLKSKHIRANLDELGSFVWLTMDGEKKVIDIAKETELKFGEKVSPVFERITMFMTQLYRNGFIYFKELKKG